MSNKDIVLWKKSNEERLPSRINHIDTLVGYGKLLTSKDKKQIVNAFQNESYEMVSTYTWIKAMTSLKSQLSKMGIDFIAEMLNRPDINGDSNIQQTISDYEAIKLAEELGVISNTSAFRLRQAMNTIIHFSQTDLEDTFENEMTEDEAKSIIRSCIQGVLIYNKIEAAIDFKNFRYDLENKTLSIEDPSIIKLLQSPYFFYRTIVSILMSLTKTASGAQLENSLANINLIIPLLWNNLNHPEKWQIGKTYSELYVDGKNKASSGLKRMLLKVGGFDFVPEDLRSNSFITAANAILKAHYGMNNFYNEPAPMTTLKNMGSVIPIPAFPICITATLCVRLGNYYGVSRAAQNPAKSVIDNVTDDRWIYFFKECLITNDRILFKLTEKKPTERFLKLFNKNFLLAIRGEVSNKSIRELITLMIKKDTLKIERLSKKLLTEIGHNY